MLPVLCQTVFKACHIWCWFYFTLSFTAPTIKKSNCSPNRFLWSKRMLTRCWRVQSKFKKESGQIDAPSCPNISGGADTASAHGVKISRVWNDLEFSNVYQVYHSRSHTKWFRSIMNTLNQSPDQVRSWGSTKCATAGMCHMCHFFLSRLFDRLNPVWSLVWDLEID